MDLKKVIRRIRKCRERESKELDLRSCNIQDLNHIPELQDCVQLEKLNLFDNRIRDIRPLEKLTELTELYLNNNQIGDISPLKKLTKLTTLQLSANLISDISPLEKLTELTKLFLSQNQIKDINPLEKLTELTTLNLSKNQIKDIKYIEKLTKLTLFGLSDNQISDIRPLEKMINLTMLYLERNQIHDFNPLLNYLPYKEDKLYKFLIEGNPNEALNQTVASGYEALKKYYDELKRQGTIPTDHLKVMVLGNSTAGKTSLVNYWGNKTFDEKQVSTHGIYTPMDIPFTYQSGESMFRVNVWDFGGQDYYHATHRLFITKDSTFIIVCAKELENRPEAECTKEYLLVDGEVKEMEMKVQHYPYSYWIQTLSHLTNAENQNNKMPLFLVENKCGSYPDDDNDKIRLSEDKKTTIPFEITGKDFYHLDIREAWKFSQNHLENIDSAAYYSSYQKFEKKLIETLQHQIKDNKYEVIAYFPEVRETLEELAKFKQHDAVSEKLNQLLIENKIKPLEEFTKLPVRITYQEYQDIVKRARKIKEKEEEIPWESLHIYLQNLCGRIFHFKNIPALKDIVFIDPDWLHQTIYKVLSQEVISNQKGEFTLKQADEVIDGNMIEAAVFLEAMRAFELIFEIPDQPERRFIAPQYLPKDCPLDEGQLEKLKTQYHQLCLTLEFPKYLPTSLISRIISLKGHLIKKMGEPLWKNGVVYSENSISTFILCHPGAKTIEIYLSQRIEDDQRKSTLRDFMIFMETHFSADLNEMFIEIPGIKGKVKWKHLYAGKKSGINGAKDYNARESGDMLSTEGFSFLLPAFKKQPVQLFICYSHKDKSEMNIFKEELSAQLESFDKQNNIPVKLFTDFELKAGDNWDHILKNNIRENDLLICLLSTGFFTSDYIQEQEYGRVFQEIADQKRHSQIVPVHFRSCYISDMNQIKNIQFFNPPASEFGLAPASEFSFCNLLSEHRTDLVPNYITKLIQELEPKIKNIWNNKKAE